MKLQNIAILLLALSLHTHAQDRTEQKALATVAKAKLAAAKRQLKKEQKAADELLKNNRKAAWSAYVLDALCKEVKQQAGQKPGEFGCVDAPKPPEPVKEEKKPEGPK